MFLSAPKPRFLLDENVRIELLRFLKQESYDVVQIRGLTNGKVAQMSVKEKRVLVTNDSDFANREIYAPDKIFSVIILRLPQSNVDMLMRSFSFVFGLDAHEFEGKIYELKEKRIEQVKY